MSNGEFDKDFGYLMPFLERVTEAVSTATEIEAREELETLLQGEIERWRRIQALLPALSPTDETGQINTSAPEPSPVEEIEADDNDLRPRDEAPGVRDDSVRPPISPVPSQVSDRDPKPETAASPRTEPPYSFTVGSLRPRGATRTGQG